MHAQTSLSDGTATLAMTYPGRPEQISAVRADLRRLLNGCPVGDEVILCASELAANAAIHSHSRLPGGEFTVRAEISPGKSVRVEVEDGGGPWTGPVPDTARGHGLDIVRSIATGWGVGGDQVSRIVWACLDWASS